MLYRQMFKISYLVLAFAFLGGPINPIAAQSHGLSRIVVKGNQFVQSDDTPIVFRGLNTSDPDKLEKEGHWNKAYFEEMKRWNANLVRFPIHPTKWAERGETAYLALIDQGVEWAGELGMYVVLDWHSIGNLRSQLFQHPMYETDLKQTFEFWRTIAKRYGDNTTVAFYELFNEPTTFNGQLGTCSWAQWKSILEEMIVIIRANGGKGIPLIAGFNWAYDLTPIKNDPIAAEGIAYVSHPYPQKRPQPWAAKWTEDWGYVKEKYPLLLTEIGFAEANEKGAHIPVISDASYGKAITGYCDEKGISYVLWVFDPRWSPSLFTDWNYTPSKQGAYFKAHLKGYKY